MNLKNSMILANMLSQKPKIMYATIKGTLTENDGVFSGFSASNYLALQQPFKLNADTVAEFCFKFNATQVANGYGVLSTFGAYGILLNFNNSSKLTLYIGDGIGNSFNVLNGALQSLQTISANTDYWVKLKFDKGVVSLLVSTDGINYSGNNTTITLAQEYVYNLTYGVGRVGTTYFRGSIDLPNSYIKIDNTKYKLQAVVGYTIVGSPTITDGVVSGADARNYITLPEYPNIESVGKFELQIKFDATSYSAGVIWSFPAPSSNSYRLQVLSSGAIRYYTPNYYVTLVGINISTINYIRLITSNGLANNVEFYVSSDGTSWTKATLTEDLSSETFVNGIMRLFRCPLSSYDLNGTYIKINNKLWFNGQQA